MKKPIIKLLRAREILDSRGNPTLEVEITTNKGRVRASVPSGASKSKYEALELRDRGERYQGKGVLKAVRNVNKVIAPRLKGLDPREQEKIDALLLKLDPSKNKKKLGANAICAVSMAVSKAGAQAKGVFLWQHILEVCFRKGFSRKVRMPRPCFNIINGGAHAGNNLVFQEFMVSPSFKNFSKNLQAGAEIYHQLKKEIKKRYGPLATNLGDEGGFAPPLERPERALELIVKAAKALGYENNFKVIIDVAASQFFKNKKYKTCFGNFSFKEFGDYYLRLISKYPILGLEDPFGQDDFEGWQNLMKRTKEKKVLLVGDDLLATNAERMARAKEKGLCNGAIIKVNQIGTVSEAIASALMAKSFGWKIIVSHRSGETCDYFIADFALGIGADFIKSGAPARGERVAKYNRLLKIEKEI